MEHGNRQGSMVGGLLLVLALLPVALVPSIIPVNGEPVGIVVPPWSSMSMVAAKVAAAGGTFLSANDRVVIARGGPDFLNALRHQGVFHAIRASAATCLSAD